MTVVGVRAAVSLTVHRTRLGLLYMTTSCYLQPYTSWLSFLKARNAAPDDVLRWQGR